MNYRAVIKVLRLTRRAQVQDTLEEQGDPKNAGWTSPQTLTRSCPSWIHSSGSVLNLRPLFTSTTLKKFNFEQEKKKKNSKHLCALFFAALPKRTKTTTNKQCESGRKLSLILLTSVSFLLTGAQLTFPPHCLSLSLQLSAILPINFTERLVPTGATWL